MVGSISTTVTVAPNDAQMLANSTPTDPAPRTIALFGTPFTSASSLVITRAPRDNPGIIFGSEPVATTRFFAVISRPSTDTDDGLRNVPVPRTTSIFWCLISASRPLNIFVTTLSL